MKITITSYPGEGKTAIALLIMDALTNAGFVVQNNDIDIEYGCEHRELQDPRLGALRARMEPIVLETVNVRKEKW